MIQIRSVSILLLLGLLSGPLAGTGAGGRQAADTRTPGGQSWPRRTASRQATGRPQAGSPMDNIHAYVCGLHFYSGQPSRQVIAHHYCARGRGELMQCVIYDSSRKDARLIGIEYVISAGLFETLSPVEQRLWHSHAYEVKSGLLAAPGLSGAAEQALMRNFATTYGKTWHTWQVDRDERLPLGIPQLMMGFTADGQVDPGLVAARDQALGVSTPELKRRRTGYPDPLVAPAADAWQLGAPLQLELRPAQPITPIPMH